MDPWRWLINFVLRFLLWIIGVWTRIWLGLKILFGCAVVTMNHLRFVEQLRLYLDSDDSIWILTMIDHIFEHRIPELNYLATATVIKHGSYSAYYSLYLMQIGRYIPRDRLRQERVEILAFIPDFFKKYPPMLHAVASFVSCIILERDHGRYYNYKTQFGNFLVQFPQTADTNRHDPLICDRERIDILRYMEKYVKPVLSDANKIIIDNTFSILAKRLQSQNRDDFMEVVLESDCYTYHGMMTALTTSVDSGVLTTEPCVQFMFSKFDKVELPAIGIVNDNLKLLIEEQFVLALLKPLNVFGIDRFLWHLSKNDLIQPTALENAVRKHVMKVYALRLDKPEHNSLIYFSRLCALSRFCPTEKNSILKMLVEFGTEYVDRMSCFQANVLCASLATLSHPKRECRVKGSDKLFEFLFKRLMSMMPELGKPEAQIDILAWQNVLLALHNMYNIGVREHHVMSNIDRRWKEKLVHASNLHLMTSQNVQAEVERANKWNYYSIMDGLFRLQVIITSNLQVIFGMRGIKSEADFMIDLPHTSSKPCFPNDTYTSSWLCSLINFTMVPKRESAPLSVPAVKAFASLEELLDRIEDHGEEENEDKQLEENHREDGEVGSSEYVLIVNENCEDEDKANNEQQDKKSDVSETVENLSDSGVGDCDNSGSGEMEKSSDSEETPNEEIEREPTWDWEYAVFSGPIRRGGEEHVGSELSLGSDDGDGIDLVENSWFRLRHEEDYDLHDALNLERERRWCRAFSQNDGTIDRLHLAEGMLVQEVHYIFEGFLRTTFNIPMPADSDDDDDDDNDAAPENNAPPRVKDPESALIIQD